MILQLFKQPLDAAAAVGDSDDSEQDLDKYKTLDSKHHFQFASLSL